MHRINQDHDEGVSNPKELQLADIRGAIRHLISNQHGIILWSKADALGRSMIPAMAASTIMNFATGKTRQPSSWTILKLSEKAAFRLVLIPLEAELPAGSRELT